MGYIVIVGSSNSRVTWLKRIDLVTLVHGRSIIEGTAVSYNIEHRLHCVV